MKCLVTGGAGFIGRHLVRYLRDRGNEVWATSRNTLARDTDGVHWLVGDVTSRDDVAGWLSKSSPEAIVHLAAQSLPGVSWESLAPTFEININGTMNLLAGLHESNPDARFIMVSSSSVYAPPQQQTLIREDSPLGGSSPYAWSKLAAEQVALLYGRQTKMDVVSVRPFFIIGPGKTGDVSSDFARRIVSVERGESTSVTVGNLKITRDFLDIEDAVRAFEVIIEHGQSGSCYNVASGEPITIRTLFNTLKSLSTKTIVEQVDPSLMRPIDEPMKVGDPSRLRGLGWAREVPLLESLRRILAYWRNP